MEEMQCILDMSLVQEKDQIKDDIFKGKGLQVLILLLNGEKTAGEIGRTLKIPIFSALVYLNRFLNANIVEEAQPRTKNGTVEKVYKLCATNLDIINLHKNNLEQVEAKKLECEMLASYFSKIVGESIKDLYMYKDDPNLVKASFIKVQKKQMAEFKEELVRLFDKFNSLENTEEKDTYALICNFSPYDVENK